MPLHRTEHSIRLKQGRRVLHRTPLKAHCMLCLSLSTPARVTLRSPSFQEIRFISLPRNQPLDLIVAQLVLPRVRVDTGVNSNSDRTFTTRTDSNCRVHTGVTRGLSLKIHSLVSISQMLHSGSSTKPSKSNCSCNTYFHLTGNNRLVSQCSELS